MASTIVCIGDSLTNGRPWLAKPLNILLAEKRPGVRIVNLGISGDTAANIAINRLTSVDFYNPFRVIVWCGINDISGGSDYSTISTYLQTIYTYFKATKGYEVFGLTITPHDTEDTTRNGIRDSLNTFIRGNASLNAVIDAEAIIRDPNNIRKRRIDYAYPGTPNHINDWAMKNLAAAFPHL